MEIYNVGDWRIDLQAGWLKRRRRLLDRRIYPDSRLIAVLRVLIQRPGEIVSGEQILNEAWPDRVVTRDSVTTAIYELRRLLGDEAASPTYIRTEPRRGYRLIASVEEYSCSSWMRPRLAAATAMIGIVIFVATSTGDPGAQTMPLQLDPLKDATQDAQFAPLSHAIDVTLRSALIRKNPGRIVTSTRKPSPSHRLQSEIVFCDSGPALVVQLLDIREQHFVWSRTYSLDHDGPGPTLVELIASDVTEALQRT